MRDGRLETKPSANGKGRRLTGRRREKKENKEKSDKNPRRLRQQQVADFSIIDDILVADDGLRRLS